MIARGLRDYVDRDWQAARDAKDAYWAERIARLGPLEGFRIAEERRRQVVRQHPDWPGSAQRRADLDEHVRFSELLRRGSRPRSR